MYIDHIISENKHTFVQNTSIYAKLSKYININTMFALCLNKVFVVNLINFQNKMI